MAVLCSHSIQCRNVGNVIAIGTFEPEIELWDLDVLEPLQPLITLGGKDEKGKFLKDSHHQAVLSLSWNKPARFEIFCLRKFLFFDISRFVTTQS